MLAPMDQGWMKSLFARMFFFGGGEEWTQNCSSRVTYQPWCYDNLKEDYLRLIKDNITSTHGLYMIIIILK